MSKTVTTYIVTVRVAVGHDEGRRPPPRTSIKKLVNNRLVGAVNMNSMYIARGRIVTGWIREAKVEQIKFRGDT